MSFFDALVKSEPFFIAEIGANHNGSVDLAKEQVLLAKESGASCVKFQSWSVESVFAECKYEDNFFLDDDYRDRSDTSLRDIVDSYSLSFDQLSVLRSFCDLNGVAFSCTPFSRIEADFLVDKLGVDFLKVASMDCGNVPYLSYLRSKNVPVLCSTGLSTIDEITDSMRCLEGCDVALAHCVSEYPTPLNKLNLSRLLELKRLFGVPVGFSDHSLGSEACVGAAYLGCRIFEKHFTSDNTMDGWDHAISENPTSFKQLVNDVSEAIVRMGSPELHRVENDIRVREFKRSIVLARALKAGHILRECDLEFKRPGTGIHPAKFEMLLGKRLVRNLPKDTLLSPTDFTD